MKRILIADDQPAARELISTILRNAGYEVIEAANGTDAAAKAAETTPDLVILDIHMPGADGLAVCARLRQDPRFASVPIVALTAGLMSGERERASKAGFTEFLSKPVSLAALRKVVACLCD